MCKYLEVRGIFRTRRHVHLVGCGTAKLAKSTKLVDLTWLNMPNVKILLMEYLGVN